MPDLIAWKFPPELFFFSPHSAHLLYRVPRTSPSYIPPLPPLFAQSIDANDNGIERKPPKNSRKVNAPPFAFKLHPTLPDV